MTTEKLNRMAELGWEMLEAANKTNPWKSSGEWESLLKEWKEEQNNLLHPQIGDVIKYLESPFLFEVKGIRYGWHVLECVIESKYLLKDEWSACSETKAAKCEREWGSL